MVWIKASVELFSFYLVCTSSRKYYWIQYTSSCCFKKTVENTCSFVLVLWTDLGIVCSNFDNTCRFWSAKVSMMLFYYDLCCIEAHCFNMLLMKIHGQAIILHIFTL